MTRGFIATVVGALAILCIFTLSLRAQDAEWQQLNKQGLQALAEKRYADAEKLFQQAVKAAEKFGKKDLRLAESLTNLGIARYAQDKLDAAVSALQSALKIREEVLGKEHPVVATTWDRLADVQYQRESRGSGVSMTIMTITATVDTSRGTIVPGSAIVMFGPLVLPGASYPETESALKKAWAIREKVLPPADPDRMRSLEKLAKIYYFQSKCKEAEPLFVNLLNLKEQSFGSGHLEYAATAVDLGRLYFVCRKLANAEMYFQRGLIVLESTKESDVWWVARAYYDMVQLLEEQGKHSEAATYLEKTIAVFERAQGPDSPPIAFLLGRYAEILRSLGRKDEAKKAEARAQAIRSKTQSGRR